MALQCRVSSFLQQHVCKRAKSAMLYSLLMAVLSRQVISDFQHLDDDLKELTCNTKEVIILPWTGLIEHQTYLQILV